MIPCYCFPSLGENPLVSEISYLVAETVKPLQDKGINMREQPASSATEGEKIVRAALCPALCATRWHSEVVLTWSCAIAVFYSRTGLDL